MGTNNVIIMVGNWTLKNYYAPAPPRGALSGDAVWRMWSVCLSVAYIGAKLRRERPRRTKIGTEVAHVTSDSDTTFKVKGQGHQAALLTAVLTRQAAAAVSVGTYWPWEITATLRSAWRRETLRRSQKEERGGGSSWRLPAYSLLLLHSCSVTRQRAGHLL